MKQLASKPLFLIAILTIPLWIVFGSLLVGIIVAVLLATFFSMCYWLYALKRGKDTDSE